MDKETLEVIRQLPYYNPNVTTDEYVLTCLIPNTTTYVYGNKLHILTKDGGMLIIDLRDVDGDLAPFHS